MRTVVMKTRGRVTERTTFISPPLKKIKRDDVADLLLGVFFGTMLLPSCATHDAGRL